MDLHLTRQGRFVAVLAALLVAFLAALPGRAAAYPDNGPQCTCTVSSQSVTEGQLITFHGRSKKPLDWNVTFNGQTRTHTGTQFVTSFRAPEVGSTSKVFQLVVDSSFARSARSSAREVTKSGACRMRFDITVNPRKGQGGPAAGQETSLPNTGGPQLALLGLAAFLLVLGTATVLRARRQRDA